MTPDLQVLRDWMEANDCTQSDLSRMLDISQGHLSAILTGKRAMTIEQSIRASVVTGIPVEKLCTDPDALRMLKLYVIRNRKAS